MTRLDKTVLIVAAGLFGVAAIGTVTFVSTYDDWQIKADRSAIYERALARVIRFALGWAKTSNKLNFSRKRRRRASFPQSSSPTPFRLHGEPYGVSACSHPIRNLWHSEPGFYRRFYVECSLELLLTVAEAMKSHFGTLHSNAQISNINKVGDYRVDSGDCPPDTRFADLDLIHISPCCETLP